MMAFLKKYLLVVLLAIVIVLAGIMFYMWRSTLSDLGNAREDLGEVEARLLQSLMTSANLSQTVRDMAQESKIRSDVNEQLFSRLDELQEGYNVEFDLLSTQLSAIQKDRHLSELRYNGSVYLKEDYIRRINTTTLDSMWRSYCATTKSCEEKK